MYNYSHTNTPVDTVVDGNKDTIVVESEVINWSLADTETVSIEEGANVEVPMIINNVNME